MSLMTCIVVYRLTNFAARGLTSTFFVRRLSVSAAAAPNVVIYASGNDSKYAKISSLMKRVIGPDSLAIYPLSRESLLQQDAAWLKNVRGLVLDDNERLSRDETARLVAFFKQGGRILDLGSNLCKHMGIGRGDGVVEAEKQRPVVKLQGSDQVRAKGFFSPRITKLKLDEISVQPVLSDLQGKLLALEIENLGSKGRAILCRLPLHLLADNIPNEVMLDFVRRLDFVSKSYSMKASEQDTDRSSTSPLFVFGKSSGNVIQALESVTLYKGVQPGSDSSNGFSGSQYLTNLQTRILGNTVIYQPVCETTMTLVKTARSHLEARDIGIICVCDRQTGGVGRAGNKWLSPDGCAMFSFNFTVGVDSGLGKRVPLVQSIAALSCVKAIQALATKKVNVGIKWPNDIYYQGKTKIGGILVQTTCIGTTMHCTIGIGLNLSNDEPTVCLDRIFRANSIPVMSREALIAGIMNNFERYADMVNAFRVNEFVEEYCANWIHSDQRVVVREECQSDYYNVPLRRVPPPKNIVAAPPASLRSGYVRRIDEYGFLVVEFHDRSVASLHPDGNSFDAMNGLILPKLAEPAPSSTTTVPNIGDSDYPRTKNVRGMMYQVR